MPRSASGWLRPRRVAPSCPSTRRCGEPRPCTTSWRRRPGAEPTRRGAGPAATCLHQISSFRVADRGSRRRPPRPGQGGTRSQAGDHDTARQPCPHQVRGSAESLDQVDRGECRHPYHLGHGHDADEGCGLGPRVTEELGPPAVGEHHEPGPVDGGGPRHRRPICAAAAGAHRIGRIPARWARLSARTPASTFASGLHGHDGHARGAELLQRHDDPQQQERGLPHPVGHEEVGEEPAGPRPLLLPPLPDGEQARPEPAGEGHDHCAGPGSATQASTRRVGVASPDARTMADSATWTTSHGVADDGVLDAARP